jgi:hypothetical protein
MRFIDTPLQRFRMASESVAVPHGSPLIWINLALRNSDASAPCRQGQRIPLNFLYYPVTT